MTMVVEWFAERPAGTATALTVSDVEIAFRWCPPGRFVMGSENGPADEQPHPVTLTSGFWMAQTPITRAEWRAVDGSDFGYSSAADANLHPLEGITWDTAIDFCQRLTEK